MQHLAELCTVHIESKLSRDTLPPQQHLRRFLRVFGKIIALYEWPSDELRDSRPNNALVMFESPIVAEDVLASSSRQGPDSFWTTQSLVAHYLRPEFMECFEKRLQPRKYLDQLKSGASSSAGPSNSQPTPDKTRAADRSSLSATRRTCPEPSPDEPPTKRLCRADAWDGSPASGYSKASASKQALGQDPTLSKPDAKNPVPPSSEWMQARIEKLEVELSAAITARDLALSEQSMAIQSLEAEQKARRKALAEKSAAEAVVSQAEAEQTRLLQELERRRRDTPLEDLRGQLDSVRAILSEVKESGEEREALLKKREAELEEARDHAHKLRIKLTDIECNGPPASTLLQEAQDEAEELKLRLEDLQNELEGVQKASNKYRLKYQNEKSKRLATKEKLAEYKSRLQLNNTLSEQLRDTAPAALQGLKAVMEAMGLPPLRDHDQLLTPKTESD